MIRDSFPTIRWTTPLGDNGEPAEITRELLECWDANDQAQAVDELGFHLSCWHVWYNRRDDAMVVKHIGWWDRPPERWQGLGDNERAIQFVFVTLWQVVKDELWYLMPGYTRCKDDRCQSAFRRVITRAVEQRSLNPP